MAWDQIWSGSKGQENEAKMIENREINKTVFEKLKKERGVNSLLVVYIKIQSLTMEISRPIFEG